MGGYGSGWHRGRRATVEEARKVDVSALCRAGALAAGYFGGWRWTWRDPWSGKDGEASIGLISTGGSLFLTYRVTPPGEDLSYSVSIERTSCNYGGSRPWLRCPNTHCGRRCRILYLAGSYFVCRTCAGLTYWTRQIHRDGASESHWIEKQREKLFPRLSRARSPEKRARLAARIKKLDQRDSAIWRALAARL